FKSRNEYENVLMKLLKKQGITKIKNIKENDIEKDKSFRKEMRNNSKIQNEDIINDVIKADDLDDDKYEILKNKINLTYNEKNMIKKKKFRKTYCYEGEIGFDLYKKFNDLFNYLKDKIQDIEIAKHDKYNEVIEEKDGKYDADNSDDINLENWSNYDIIGYTPTIVAGISYEENYFDKIFGYFINSSSCAEMTLQQLFRVRNLNDNDINICIENKDSSKYLTKVDDIKQYIIDRNTCLIDGVMG
ncbi:hypothetical protein CU098_003881, partial [Rhizopus stolonifer]